MKIHNLATNKLGDYDDDDIETAKLCADQYLSLAEQHRTDAQKCEQAHKAVEANTPLYIALRKAVGEPPVESVLALKSHRMLMYRFLSNNCQHFSSLSKAISAATDDKMLVYIAELHLYGVFTPVNYFDFTSQLEEGTSFTPKQISLSAFRQRVVFVCEGDDKMVTRMVKYCERHFASYVRVVADDGKNDIIMQSPIVENLIESKRLFAEFVEDLKLKAGPQKFNIKQAIESEGGVEFVTSRIQCDKPLNNPADIMQYLTGLPQVVTVNFNNYGGSMFIGGSGNTNYVKASMPKDQLSDAVNWIKSNPPMHREIKSAYYERYIAGTSATNHISDRSLNKLIVETLGRKTLKSCGKTYWMIPGL